MLKNVTTILCAVPAEWQGWVQFPRLRIAHHREDPREDFVSQGTIFPSNEALFNPGVCCAMVFYLKSYFPVTLALCN